MAKRRRKNASSKEFEFFIQADLSRFAGQSRAIVGDKVVPPNQCTNRLATGQAAAPRRPQPWGSYLVQRPWWFVSDGDRVRVP